MELPTDISVMRFAAARVQEIAALTDLIENPTTTKLIFQKLPCHMRRRAMSHNPKRMPRLLREAHKSQMEKSGVASAPKRPRRKYRRRPSRLLEEYERRSKKIFWMETHIWHAKRFHMSRLWSHQIPYKSCDRSFRFCYRSVAQHCILMDVSYLHCIEIQGPENNILDGMNQLCDAKVGLTFRSLTFLKGNDEGRVMLYRKQRYPQECIGWVTYCWRYGDTDPQSRSLWVWVHPAFYQQLLSELYGVFNLNESGELINSELDIKLILNQGKLNRFRLRGPNAYSVLGGLVDNAAHLQSLRAGFISALEVRDPRITLPSTRTKASALTQNTTSGVSESESSRSILWDPTSREEISRLRKLFPDHEINNRRHQLLVPGSVLPPQPEEKPIPLLIINAPHEGDRFIAGCDVILPAGWGTAFWVSLIFNGGRAGALYDSQRMNFEYRICRDLNLELDSEAGRAAAEQRRIELMETYFKKPPKTRTNFIKMATPFPFGIDWKQLVDDWLIPCPSLPYVCRDKAILRSLSFPMKNPSTLNVFSEPCLVSITVKVRRGCPQEFAMICLPRPEDSSGSLLTEPTHKDPAAKERKVLRQQHRIDLKRLARKRKEKMEDGDSANVSQIFHEKMRSLWLPQPSNLKTCYLRPIVGFLTQGDYALQQGQGVGRGYILAHTLPMFKSNLVIVRNPGTNCYMWADISLN